jgi:hypothetical protein
MRTHRLDDCDAGAEGDGRMQRGVGEAQCLTSTESTGGGITHPAMNIPLVSLMGLLALPASADLIVYRYVETGRSIGAGDELKIRGQGYFVLDHATFSGQVIVATTIDGQKLMVVQALGDTTEYTVTGLKGRTYTAWQGYSFSPDPEREVVGSFYALNSLLKVRADGGLTYPKSFTQNYQSVRDSDGFYVLYASRATFAFRRTDTIDANTFALTVEDVIEVYRQQFAAKGYVFAP